MARSADPIFRDFNIYVGGRRYLPWDFVILTRNSPDGITGNGAVKEHKTLLSAMYSTMKYESVISKTGGNKKGFLESEKKLTKAAIDELKQQWRDLYTNNENNMLILNDGLKYTPSASTSVEMQLNENKRTNSEQIAQIFGVSPAVLSGNCTTAEYMSAVRTAVLPVVEQFQSALNRSLLREDEKGKKYFTLDTTELLKGDTLSRYQAYEIALRNNFLQLDEVRYLEDKKPLGFNFMKLGLNDVLLDPKSNTVYTPNMNALTKLGNQNLTNDEMRAIMEYRKKTNWIKGAHGHFAGSYPEGGGSASVGRNSEKMDLTNNGDSDIMEKSKECFIHDDKINKFCLLPGAKHSMEFFGVGYTVNDGARLKEDIIRQFDMQKAVDIVNTQNKEKFSIFMELGVTKKRRFRTVWEKRDDNSTPRFITAHRE